MSQTSPTSGKREPASQSVVQSDDEEPTFGPLSWLLLLTRATYISLTILAKAIASIPPSRRPGLSFHEYVAYTGIRDYQCGLGAAEVQHLRPLTGKTCRQWARKHGIPCHEIHLPGGVRAFQLGPRKPEKVVVLFHGGGYMGPILWQDMDMAFGFENPRPGLAIVVLQYSLASEHRNRYPKQLREGVSLLQHLLHDEAIPPSAITLVGESAGGHLLLGLFLHINHPHPAIPPLGVEGTFAGAALISPWVELNDTSSAFKQGGEDGLDLITASRLAYWASNILDGAKADSWNSPLTAPKDWWETLPVDELLVTYGKDELLRDDVARLGELLGAARERVAVIGCEGELHAHMVMNRFLKINKPCKSEKTFVEWLEKRLESGN
ncbi:Alpha/Beta hydrolase protein [Coniochaeta sp. 2T2.1]|nr:Alpha/Beta hydrolase protein [Coniochaeta sp. 2T2.1]